MSEIMQIFGQKQGAFPVSRFANARILVVDDINLNLKLICSKLSASGYKQLETAVDGIDALKKTYQMKPDLVLLDIMMPNLDGFGYCEQIRADKNAAHMPIIVQTALEDRETKLRALSCGADDFINKPLDLEEVALRIHVHLERYFMLQDLEDMRGYLQMELDKAQNIIRHLEMNTAPESSGRTMFDKHYDVLKTLAQPHSHN